MRCLFLKTTQPQSVETLWGKTIRCECECEWGAQVVDIDGGATCRQCYALLAFLCLPLDAVSLAEDSKDAARTRKVKLPRTQCGNLYTLILRTYVLNCIDR